jgi:hypothetical protein
LKIIKIPYKIFLLCFVLFISATDLFGQYSVGDYGTISSGNWNGSIWGTWNGSTWTPVAGSPAATNNAFILGGTTVVLPAGGPYPVKDLTVEAGAKLWTANNSVNVYISVFGAVLKCDGQIGDGATFDGVSVNIESANCTISGTGMFDASRLRKNSAVNTTTNLIIGMNINLRWNSASGTQLYNGASGTRFNVTINAFCTVNLIPNGPNIGNVCIDGLSGTQVALDAGGTFTVNGTLIISGILYLTTNNSNVSYSCSWVVNGLLQANEVVASASGLAQHSFVINSGGKLDITGTPAFSSLATTNNMFNFAAGSTVEYSAAGAQQVRVKTEFGTTTNQEYGNLILSNSGLKSTNYAPSPNLYVKNDLTISGSAILDPNPGTSIIFLGGNWLNYNATGFAEKTTTVRFTGSSMQTISCPGGEVYNVLTYAKGGSFLQFNNPVDIISQLTYSNNGYIDLNSNALTLRNSASNAITGISSSRYIVSEKTDNSSKIIWKINNSTGTYTFPFGVTPGGSANYIPVVLYKNSATDLGDVTISTYGTPANNLPWPSTPTNVTNLQAYFAIYNAPDNRHYTVDRFWEVSSSTPVVTDSLAFNYRQLELPDLDPTPTNLAAQFWADAYSVWNLTQWGTGTSYKVVVPNFIYYNTSWTLTSLTSPLPVELLNFEATAKEKHVELRWSTATEVNNQLFTVEKSLDGFEFFEIGTRVGAGNSNTMRDYYLADDQPVYGISYYRLKQTDYDGKFTYSETVPVSYKKKQSEYSVFPNPAGDNVYIIGAAGEKSEVMLRTTDGKLVKQFSVDGSRQITPLTLSGLSEGMYMLEIQTESETQFLRLIKR